jgi:hypothetical protein
MESVPKRWRDGRMMFKLGVAVALVGGAIVGILLVSMGGSRVRGPVPPPERLTGVSAWVDARHPGAPVPDRFLGLSFELSSAAQISRYAGGGDFATLLRSLGPGVLRLGGASADTRVAWTDAHTARPPWASSVLTPADLDRLGRLARGTGWGVLLTIGLVHFEPRAAAREAAAARAALGPWLLGIELGNEPDSYALHNQRGPRWGYATYNAQVSAYRRAIARATPGIAVAGPGVSGSGAFRQWGPAEALAQHPALLTGHHYPLGCHSAVAHTDAQLLSGRTRARETESLRTYVSVAQVTGVPFRMDETNSVSCGGEPGVSNTFAAALWAVSYIAQAMASGAAGINFEGNPASCEGYSPVCASSTAALASGALRPQPEWYALLLTRGLIGDRPVRTVLPPHRRTNLAVTTLLGPRGGLKVVIVDDDPPGSRRVKLSLHVGGRGRVESVLALTAPSPHSTSGVRLGGEWVSAQGSWRSPRLSRLDVRGGVIAVVVAPSSAALVSVSPSRPQAHKPAGRAALRLGVRGRPARSTRSCARTGCAKPAGARRGAPQPRGWRRG